MTGYGDYGHNAALKTKDGGKIRGVEKGRGYRKTVVGNKIWWMAVISQS